MLYPILTKSRSVIDLCGVWKFKLETDDKIDVKNPLSTSEYMAVPGSFNDQGAIKSIRHHVGNVYYERNFIIPKILLNERIVLRLESVTHYGTVYINGKKVVEHRGGFTPFEAEINNFIIPGENRLTIVANNILDTTTLPVGNYSEEINEEGKLIRKVDENFDFFNYAGIQRPVKIYTTPYTFVEDITVVPEVFGTTANIKISTLVYGEYDNIVLTVFDEENEKVSTNTGNETVCTIENVHLWKPLNSYLYNLQVEVLKDGKVVDTYTEPFGVRTVKIENGKFLINGEPFYFKGFGKHEDTYINGRGMNEAVNVMDLNLMKWLGANSFRTSHYPYSEEMMRLADREGFVVIDETTAVGLFSQFSADLLSMTKSQNTWDRVNTTEAHEQVIRELIQRDKNHACVVMWSIANEPATHEDGAYEYFEPLFKLARSLDPQKRPTTFVNLMLSMPNQDKVMPLADVICLNRYYGWYVNNGDISNAKKRLREELKDWRKLYPEKPIMFTEYGADTITGFHAIDDIPFTEEYQERLLEATHEVVDEFENFVGEQIWNFADFETKTGVIRVQGNKKGVFTRSRQPKMVAYSLKKRWMSIPNFGYKK